MYKICLDVEGVLLPEIWIKVAKHFGNDRLLITTKDEPDYNKLMNFRISELRTSKIKYKDILSLLTTIDPLEGALNFLKKLRDNHQVALISDSYYEFLYIFKQKLDYPELYCHTLSIDRDGYITDWCPRIVNQKGKCVKAFQSIGFSVISVGDSYNDIEMLMAAEKGFFINTTKAIKETYNTIECVDTYDMLLQRITHITGVN